MKTSQLRAPKAFMSHTSLDKVRIVTRLDQLLRDRGVDVWLDDRELLPGKNLVDEIFTNGISNADVFIVVLSKNSIDRPWVTEELSVAIVQKIAGIVKMIIPIILDDVVPPPVLKATIWERVPDLEHLELHADRIAASIFGARPAPVAQAPEYAGLPVHRMSGITADDERVFAAICASMIASQVAFPFALLPRVAEDMNKIGMSAEMFWESVEVLGQAFYLSDLSHYAGDRRPGYAKIPSHAFHTYLEAYRPAEYRAEKIAILSAIANEGASESRAIAVGLSIHEYVVNHVLDMLEAAGHIQGVRTMDGMHFRTNSTIKRALRASADEA